MNISLSAHANANEYYSKKKKKLASFLAFHFGVALFSYVLFSEAKCQKTVDAAERAVKAAEKKTRRDIKEVYPLLLSLQFSLTENCFIIS